MAPVIAKATLYCRDSHSNSSLMLRDSVGERLTLEVVFRYGFCKLVKIPSLSDKVPLLFLRKKGCLGKLRHQGFIAFLVVDRVCYSFATVRSVTYREKYRHEFMLGMCWNLVGIPTRTAFWYFLNVSAKNWHLRSYLDIGLANKLKFLVWAAKYHCRVFLRKITA